MFNADCNLINLCFIANFKNHEIPRKTHKKPKKTLIYKKFQISQKLFCDNFRFGVAIDVCSTIMNKKTSCCIFMEWQL